MRKATSALLLIAAAAIATPARAATIEQIAAIVDDAVILESEVLLRATPSPPPVKPTPPTPDQRKLALEELIDNALIATGAKAHNLEVANDEINSAIKEIRTQNKLDEPAFAVALQTAGYAMPVYRRMVAEQLLRLRLVNVLFGTTTVSETEIEAAYRSLTSTMGSDAKSLAETRETLRTRLRTEKLAASLKTWLEGARRAAYIERRANSPLSPSTWSGRTVTSMAFRGEQLAIAVPSVVHVGATIDRELVARTAHELWATGALDDLRIELSDDGALLFVSRGLPVVRQLDINGVRATPAQSRDLGLAPGNAIAPARIRGALHQWRVGQQRLGFYWVEARDQSTRVGVDQIDVALTISTGPKVPIDIRFVGNQKLSTATLTDGLVMTPEELLDTDNNDWQTRALLSMYFDHGMIDARITSTINPAIDRSRVTIVLAISEGPAYVLGTVNVAGELFGNEKETLAILGLIPGSVFSRSGIIDAIGRFQRRGEADGRGWIGVDIATTIDRGTVALRLQAQRGAAPRFGAISIMGREGARCKPKLLVEDPGITNASAETFTSARLEQLLAKVGSDCRILSQSRNYGANDRELDVRLIVHEK